jgi:hypothetical protein
MEDVNDGIRGDKVRAVFPDGSAEVMPTAVAVRAAQAMGLDIVLIAPTAVPPWPKPSIMGSGCRKEIRRNAATTEPDTLRHASQHASQAEAPRLLIEAVPRA